MLLVYTGDGKGKTTAAVGQTLRALGQDMAVAFGQFMKRDGQAGEQRMLRGLLGERFLAGGVGFFHNRSAFGEHRAAAEDVLRWARDQLASGLGLLVLDETCCALHAELVDRGEVEGLIQAARAANCHLVLTGRGAPEWLVEIADLVTEMREVKHPYRSGVKAQAGIEW